jgi:hypothetical protein
MIPRAVLAVEAEPRELIPEQRLFAAVIYQAILDATRLPTQWDRTYELQDQAGARAWLTRGSRDFRMVCDYAGIDGTAILDKCRELAMHGWQRETILSGPRATMVLMAAE